MLEIGGFFFVAYCESLPSMICTSVTECQDDKLNEITETKKIIDEMLGLKNLSIYIYI